jgi:hypothetical protein
MKKVSVLLSVMAVLVAVGQSQDAPSADDLAQQAQKDAQVQTMSTGVCQSTFTSGSGLSYMKFCTTQNGNVAKFESPSTFNQLHQGGEGYGLCDVTNGSVGYYDWGVYGDSGWQSATMTQPKGPNTFPLTITRTTADGVWTLEQVFSRNPATPAAKITMTLKNNSAVTRQVYLERFGDVDADGTSVNVFDTTGTSAFGRSVFGLMLKNLTLEGMSLGGRIVEPGTTNPCNTTLVSIPFKGNASTLLLWAFYGGKSIAPQQSKTVTLEYRAF